MHFDGKSGGSCTSIRLGPQQTSGPFRILCRILCSILCHVEKRWKSQSENGVSSNLSIPCNVFHAFSSTSRGKESPSRLLLCGVTHRRGVSSRIRLDLKPFRRALPGIDLSNSKFQGLINDGMRHRIRPVLACTPRLRNRPPMGPHRRMTRLKMRDLNLAALF